MKRVTMSASGAVRGRRKFLRYFKRGFRDMIDLQSFIWVQGSDEYPI
ncbi:MAG: hypothetical protein ABI795_06825 [Chthoniobacterales bacterium]